MGFLSSLTGSNIGNATKNAVTQNNQILTNFQNAGNSIIDTGEQKSAGALSQAVGNYDPYLATGNAATSMYGNALGLNGADGTAAAQEAFTASPAYQFNLDQGTQAALRSQSAAGMLNSGNTLTALTGYASGLASNEYNNWLSNLSNASSQGLTAAGGQGGFLSGLSNLYQGTAGQRLGLENSVATGRMTLNNDLAKVQESQAKNSSGFLGGLLNAGLGIGSKALTGGLF